jgi:ribonuclease HI
MRFRDTDVFVRVDANGKPVLGPDGRGEMKYRLSDPRSYRPAPSRLEALPGDKAGAPFPDDAAAASVPADPGTTNSASAGARGKRPGGPGKPGGASRGARGAGTATSSAPVADPATSYVVYTDGACSGNPGPAGIGVVIMHGGERRELSEYLGEGTNNIAELTAVKRALEELPDRERRVVLHLDSEYVRGLLVKGWKAKANQTLVEELRALARTFRDLHLVYVPGHAGVSENERCDALARQAIMRGR